MRLHELKEQLDNSERSIIDAKTNFELEQAQRRRLETRLKAAIDLSKKDNESGVSPVKIGGGHEVSHTSKHFNANLTSQRNSILYGQDLDESTSVYDETILAYDDDNVLMDSTRGSPIQTNSKTLYNAPALSSNDNFPSPPSKINNQSTVNQSPVDRVSAALAARAAAESSKAALKQAQQMRNIGRQQQYDQQPDTNSENPQMKLYRRPSKGKVQDVRDLKDKSADDDEMEEDDDDFDVGYVPPQKPDEGQVNIEDSISKTEMFLRQRLSKVAGDNSSNSNYSSAAQAATEMAQAVYNRQQQKQNTAGAGEKEGAVYLYSNEQAIPKFSYGSAGNHGPTGNYGHDDVNVNVPKLRPASPPNKNLTLMEEEDDDDQEDSPPQNKVAYAPRHITLGGDPPSAAGYKEPISTANSKAIQKAMDASVGIQLPKIISANNSNDHKQPYTVSVKKRK